MWHYQVIQHDGYVGIHELIEIDGKLGWTEEPELVGDDVPDLLHQLELMKKDIEEYGVTTEEELKKL
jgi:hypothetical protein